MVFIEERDSEIANRILRYEYGDNLRFIRNQQAKDSGFDIKIIGEYMSKIYLSGSI